jgi:hypothetical protein
MTFVARVCSLAALTTPLFGQDVLTLTDGTRAEGRVVFESAERVVLRTGSKERELAAAQIAQVQSLARSQREVLAAWRTAPQDRPGAMIDLAKVAAARGLEGEADLFAWMALALDPACEAAHEMLGHERSKGVWNVPLKHARVPFEQVVEQRADFSEAWRLKTLHFALRSNLPLSKACAAALELEFAYRAFFDWLQPRLEFHEVVERIAVQVHADQRSYPGGSANRGFFSRELNTAFLDASEGLEPGALVHETTHALLFNTAMRTRASLGNVPAWLDEGMSDTLRTARTGKLANPLYDFEQKAVYFVAIHAGAKKPMDLSRVLALSVEDFTFSSHIGLAYAQSYTLVRFCLRGEDRKYEPGFIEYLRSCYAGKSAITEFKARLEIEKERDFEQAWIKFVRDGG